MPATSKHIIHTLQQRGSIKARIRQFFMQRQVLEVDVPALAVCGVTDPQIENIVAQVNGREYYLQSSPEYFMKRLLAAGSGSIYSLNYAYRDEEFGVRHLPEFMMLEWYRVGWNEYQLMAELADLLKALGFADLPCVTLSFAEAFTQATGVDFWSCDIQALQEMASAVADNDFSGESESTCLDLIFSLKIEPALPGGLVFIKHYPAGQSALAKVDHDEQGRPVARRFEAFLNRVEIANGYFELNDAVELRQRFEADQQLRNILDKPYKAIDEKFLAAVDDMPDCAGVALGIDRVLMTLFGMDDIRDVLSIE